LLGVKNKGKCLAKGGQRGRKNVHWICPVWQSISEKLPKKP
jgi:hypothetical protein